MGYRCKAVNVGPNQLSDVRLICAGKMSATRFLPSHEELDLDGVLLIENNTELIASVEGKVANGTVYTNNTSIAIRMISPLIKLEVRPQTQFTGAIKSTSRSGSKIVETICSPT